MEKFKDPFMEEILQDASAILQEGNFPACRPGSSFARWIGIPALDWNDLESRGRGMYQHRVTGAWIREYGRYLLVYVPNGQPLPKKLSTCPKKIDLVSAELDKGARTVTIQKHGEQVTFSGINCASYNELIVEINEELVRIGHEMRVVSLVVVEGDASGHIYPKGNIPYLQNSHTRCPASGLALDKGSHTLVYAGLVGYKTSLDSLWATLCATTNTRRTAETLTVNGSHGSNWSHWCVPCAGGYRRVVVPLPEQTSQHMCAIARTAAPGQWNAQDTVAYALCFGEDSISEVLFERLNECLKLPLLKSWAERLFQAALEKGLVTRLTVCGDCRDGVCIQLEDETKWTQLLEELLAQGVLNLEESENEEEKK